MPNDNEILQRIASLEAKREEDRRHAEEADRANRRDHDKISAEISRMRAVLNRASGAGALLLAVVAFIGWLIPLLISKIREP